MKAVAGARTSRYLTASAKARASSSTTRAPADHRLHRAGGGYDRGHHRRRQARVPATARRLRPRHRIRPCLRPCCRSTPSRSPLGDSAAVEERDPVMVLPTAGASAVSLAFVVSRREFLANWEYLLDSAIFITPPTPALGGRRALIDRRGRLVGVGSLLVRDSAPDRARRFRATCSCRSIWSSPSSPT
ncbi:MAG: hypothetical protein MZW92_21865 [Comamonadaceae bacterium]|nr:hypothetical protein [Comamonadaceae bacterium]